MGITGRGFLGPAMNPATGDGQTLITHLKPIPMGWDPPERELLNRDLWPRQPSAGVRTIGAAEIALRDIAGKAVDQPIPRLLGTFRISLPAYASPAVLASPAAYAEEAQSFQANSQAAQKRHPPAR